MSERRALTLIVVRPGPLPDGIEALLASVPRVKVIGTAVEHPLDLLSLDASLPRRDAVRLSRTYRRWRPDLRCIALPDNAAHEWTAKDSGADTVFLTGFPADRFVETVERLLSEAWST